MTKKAGLNRPTVISTGMADVLVLKHLTKTLLTVLDSIDATIYVADMHFRMVLFINRRMKELFGEGLVGQRGSG